MRVGLSLALVGAVQAAPAMYKVVEMLREIKATTEKDLETALDGYKKTKCTVKMTTEKNNQLIKDNEEKISDANQELDALGSTTLTDESQRLSDAIAAKKKEKADAVQKLEDATKEHNAYIDDLISGIGALNDANTQLANTGGPGLLSQKTRVITALSQKLSPEHQQLLNKAMAGVNAKQAPAAYESQLGTIIKLVKNLIVEYEAEKIDAERQFKKMKTAQDAVITGLGNEVADLTQQFETGAGEAAAKEKREAELNDLIGAATKENNEAKAENTDMAALGKTNEDEYAKFSADGQAKLAAIKAAVEILHNDEARSHFHKVADQTGTFLLQKAAKVEREVARKASVAQEMETQSAAIQVLLDAIDDFSSELSVEKKAIIESMNECTDKSTTALTAARDEAEQVDGFSAKVASLSAQIEACEENQKELTEKIAEEKKLKEEKNADFDARVIELTGIQSDLNEAARVSKKAIVALQAYSPDGAVHGAAAGSNPLEGVITMIQNLVTGFENDAKDQGDEITTLTKLNTKMNTEVGSISDDKYDGESPSIVSVKDADSIIGGLETERNDSVQEAMDATTERTENANFKSGSLKTLYGDDGTGGIVGDFGAMQPGCDYWLINGEARKTAIEAEKKALTNAKSVLSVEGLGLAEGDEASLEAREAGADAKKHEQEHVKKEHVKKKKPFSTT